MGLLWNWLAARLSGLCALALAAALAWQTARIDGLPLIGGGLRVQVTGLQAQIAARDLAQAKAESAALLARDRLREAQNRIVARASTGDRAIQSQIQTVIREVPRAIPNDRDCLLPWGAVRLLDAAASGAGIDDVAAAIAPGQPDDAPSGIKLSDLVALQAANLGAARRNAGQLEALQQAVQQ
jgi:hypothetical protein